ncbi:MAG: hypothetical protein HY744_00970 [Deltaproteobacteria bacterium]|nr:hypothetical protein [Deltaproteobacteria bacterium]
MANGKPGCTDGKCGIGSCNAGFADCDKQAGNGCEIDLNTDVANCGSCGKNCAKSETCQNGQCLSPQFCYSIGYDSCPTNAKTWCDVKPINKFDSGQAKKACELCQGQGCADHGGDCAGMGFGTCLGGCPHWGYQAGCSGDAGRVWRYGTSFTTYGRWAPP